MPTYKLRYDVSHTSHSDNTQNNCQSRICERCIAVGVVGDAPAHARGVAHSQKGSPAKKKEILLRAQIHYQIKSLPPIYMKAMYDQHTTPL